MKITKDLFSQNYELKSFHFPAERKKAGLVKMCRVGGEVECREVSVAWVRDRTDTRVMAVRTEEGWREIMVSVEWGGGR